MKKPQLIWAGQEANNFDRSQVGGKGLNLLRLYSVAQDTQLFRVPNFFIIPEGYPYGSCTGAESFIFEDDVVKKAFERLKKPVIARSSSPLEDGINASFAGMFSSFPDQNSYEQLVRTLHAINLSACADHVKRYAQRMRVDYDKAMAFIIQEQVTDFLFREVIQLEENGATIENTTKQGHTSSHDIEYRFLREMIPEDEIYTPKTEQAPRDFVNEREFWYAVHCAKKAADIMGLEGVVQVECCLAPQRQPELVQIRQLPKVTPPVVQLDMDIPRDVPYIESQVCNGIAGEVVLPAYVTFSQSGFSRILIELGYMTRDERWRVFCQRSKLARSTEFQAVRNIIFLEKEGMTAKYIRYFEQMWSTGNSLFPEYILVCDRLDETLSGMAQLTEGKKGIITCLEASKTSHAMTVARDLGIPAMGVDGDISDPDYFFNQIETGDIVHMKSDGKRAVAYVERRRD
jgi:phosphohistidine swiveling domain-containing protein